MTPEPVSYTHLDVYKRQTLILFAVGAVLALLIGNVYMVPIMGIGFSLLPVWYLHSTSASYKKHLNEELETAISIITTSYLRTEDIILSLIHICQNNCCLCEMFSHNKSPPNSVVPSFYTKFKSLLFLFS